MRPPHRAGFVAALDRSGWWVPELVEPVEPEANGLPAATPAQILDTALLLDARQVWIYPDRLAGLDDWTAVDGWDTRPVVATWGAPVWVWCHRQLAGKRVAVDVCLLDPHPGNRTPWRDLEPPVLLAELAAFSDALGERWRLSGAVTSDGWLRSHYRAPGGLRLAPSAVPPVTHSTRGPAAMRHWHRPLTPAERDAAYVHSFDVNGMFLAAASSLALPAGDAIHYTVDNLWTPGRAADPKAPGWWLLDGEEHWIPTPTLELAVQRGLPRDAIREAYVWPVSHRWLEPWYRALRIARAQLAGDRPAGRALKLVYSAGVARLGSLHRLNGAADPLYQPYWGAAVRAEANARLERKLHRVRDHHGITPVALDVDCTWWVTDQPDPAAFAASIGVAVDDQLGHFKHAGTRALTPELVESYGRAGNWHQATELLEEVNT